jgi:Fe-S-cluster containining protein
MPDDSYKKVLDRADAWFAGVMRDQPQNLQCGRGCSLCCYGLFEIGSGDIPLLAEGLETAHPSRRRAVIRRAVEIVSASQHPNLRDCSPLEKEAFFDRTAQTPCPNLNDRGECVLYEHRPLVCRTFGLPLRNGDDYLGDVCELNFTDAQTGEPEAAAWDLQWEDELGPEDEFTIPEAIVLIARMRGWLG